MKLGAEIFQFISRYFYTDIILASVWESSKPVSQSEPEPKNDASVTDDNKGGKMSLVSQMEHEPASAVKAEVETVANADPHEQVELVSPHL